MRANYNELTKFFIIYQNFDSQINTVESKKETYAHMHKQTKIELNS